MNILMNFQYGPIFNTSTLIGMIIRRDSYLEFVCNTGATFSIQPTYVGRILSLAFILNLYLIGQAYDVSAHEIVHIVMNVVLVFSLITFIHLFLIQAGLHPRICEIFKSYSVE